MYQAIKTADSESAAGEQADKEPDQICNHVPPRTHHLNFWHVSCVGAIAATVAQFVSEKSKSQVAWPGFLDYPPLTNTPSYFILSSNIEFVVILKRVLGSQNLTINYRLG